MLSVRRLGSGAVSYYMAPTRPGKGSKAAEPPGMWMGGGSSYLGLWGEVRAEELRAVLKGRDPSGGSKLGTGQTRVAGFDLTFAAPKSVSILHALGSDHLANELLEIHSAAVCEVLCHLEREVVRVQRKSNMERWDVGVTGLLAAGFVHRTSRALDPHLHTHVVLANLAQGLDGRWSAIDARGLYRQARTSGLLYQAQLRHEISTRLKLSWGECRDGIADLESVDRAVIRAFSTRQAQIEAFLEWRQDEPLIQGGEELGRVTASQSIAQAAPEKCEESDIAPSGLISLGGSAKGWEARRERQQHEWAADITRQAKSATPPFEELQELWRKRARSMGWLPQIRQASPADTKQLSVARSDPSRASSDIVPGEDLSKRDLLGEGDSVEEIFTRSANEVRERLQASSGSLLLSWRHARAEMRSRIMQAWCESLSGGAHVLTVEQLSERLAATMAPSRGNLLGPQPGPFLAPSSWEPTSQIGFSFLRAVELEGGPGWEELARAAALPDGSWDPIARMIAKEPILARSLVRPSLDKDATTDFGQLLNELDGLRAKLSASLAAIGPEPARREGWRLAHLDELHAYSTLTAKAMAEVIGIGQRALSKPPAEVVDQLGLPPSAGVGRRSWLLAAVAMEVYRERQAALRSTPEQERALDSSSGSHVLHALVVRDHVARASALLSRRARGTDRVDELHRSFARLGPRERGIGTHQRLGGDRGIQTT